MTSQPRTISLNMILFEREPGHWVAQGLQYDIGAQATNLPDLFYETQKSLVGHVLICDRYGQAPFECLPPAPQLYWDMAEQQQHGTITPRPPLGFRVPRPLVLPSLDPVYTLVGSQVA